MVHTLLVGIFNLPGFVLHSDAVQPLYAHPDGGSLDSLKECRNKASPSSEGCRRGGDLRMFKLRTVPGCLSDECPEEELEVLVGVFHQVLEEA